MKKKKIATIVALAILSIAIAVPAGVSAAGSVASARPGSMTAYFKELIQGLVDQGKLAKTDADATLSSLDAKAAELKGNRSSMAGDRGAKGRLGGLDLAEVASTLGITEDQLNEKLTAGTSLWKIASDAGKLAELKAAIIKQAEEKLAANVTDGRMTQAEADTALSALKEKVGAITADSTDVDLGVIGGRGGRGGHDMTDTANGSTAEGSGRPAKGAGRTAGSTADTSNSATTGTTSAA